MLETESCKLKTENRDARRVVEELILVLTEITKLVQYRLALRDPVPVPVEGTGGFENSYVYPSYIPSGW